MLDVCFYQDQMLPVCPLCRPFPKNSLGYSCIFWIPLLTLCLWVVVGLETGGVVPKIPKRCLYAAEIVSAQALVDR